MTPNDRIILLLNRFNNRGFLFIDKKTLIKKRDNIRNTPRQSRPSFEFD
jgi:hypothetical protein